MTPFRSFLSSKWTKKLNDAFNKVKVIIIDARDAIIGVFVNLVVVIAMVSYA